MELIIAGVIIFIVGIIVGRSIKLSKCYGVIRVDASDPNDTPYLFLELHDDKSINNIMRKRYVTFRVDILKLNSQK